ncbi:MAG: N-6 DNA methylase [Anaerolineae bacterium]|nr:N-6 DNA methylase [Anaerolineae bacterium]
MAAGIKPDSAAIKQYYQMLEGAEGQDALHEGNVRRAFETLLRETARDAKKWELVTEQSERRAGTLVRYDGVLRDQWRLPHGYWEAKDTHDDLDTEIRKKRDRGYPLTNIIFEDTREAVLFQDNDLILRADVRQPEALAGLLTRFFSHDIPPFVKFGEAVTYFQGVIPEIAGGLKGRIEAAHRENTAFGKAFDGFMAVCKASLNPNISPAAVDEMLIQHMLTARLIAKIFTEGFTQRNAIAAEIETVIGALTSAHFNPKDFLGALDRFYTAIEDAAEKLADYSQKQTFINTVYERFFQGYSVKVADTHGIVYTPQPIVDFMCAAVEEVLLTEFGKKLGDPGVYIIDPCTGTGNFAVNLLRRAHERNPRGFDRFYREQLFANEVMLMPYYIASLNIEHEYFALAGKYEPFEGVCFVDTLDLAERADGQMGFSFMTEKNAARVERQKRAPITVIIGNPPYNVGQLNENDNNKNRAYEVIDGRVAKTYAKDSKATLNRALYDPYVKFFRWASDRLGGRDGVVCYVSNNSFVDQIAFDGMRKHLLNDFTAVYHLDLHGNVRQNPKLSGTTHNVFGIQVGVGITVAVRSSKHHGYPIGNVDAAGNVGASGSDALTSGSDAPTTTPNTPTKPPARLLYHRVPEFWTRAEKLAFLADHVERKGRENALNTVEWTELTADNRNTWLVPENADQFDAFIPIGSREAKSAKGQVEAIFKTYSRGIATNADNYIFDFDRTSLIKRMQHIVHDYRVHLGRWLVEGQPKSIDGFLRVDEKVHKWIRNTKRTLLRGQKVEFDERKIRLALYRPFTKRNYYFERVFNEDTYQFPRIFPISETERENQVIIVGGYGRKDFAISLTNTICDVNFYADPAQCFPFYSYDEDGSNRRENITDWALKQFQERYSPRSDALSSDSPRPEGEGLGVRVISKWDIFYYVYALLHHPAYRAKFADNLKRELPRIPFVGDSSS